MESVLAEVSEVRKMKIIPCEKNQNNYRLIRRNHLIFPEIVKGNLKQTNLRRVKIFHSASSINNNKIFLHKNENSISKILHINTSAEKRTEEKTKSMLSFSKTEDNVEIENENQSLFLN